MLRDVRFVVTDRRVTVTNRQTGGVIFSGSLSNLSAGTFYSGEHACRAGRIDVLHLHL